MSEYTNNIIDLNNKNQTWTILYEYIQPKSTVLDIGCSSGYFAKELIDCKECIVDGIEINANDARLARKICREVKVANIEEYCLQTKLSAKYDYIIFADVLEHLVDPVIVLRNVKKLLKENGRILFSIPNMAHISVRLELINGSFEYGPNGLLDRTHLHFYTKETILEVIEKSGLYINDLKSSIYDIPKSIIDEGLKRAGLKADEKFYTNIQKEDAIVFQYVGMIGTKKSSISTTASVRPFKAIESNNDDRKKMMNHIVNLEKLNKALSKELADLHEKSRPLNNSFSKVLKKMHGKKK